MCQFIYIILYIFGSWNNFRKCNDISSIVLGTHTFKEAKKTNPFDLTEKHKPETYTNVSRGDNIMLLTVLM